MKKTFMILGMVGLAVALSGCGQKTSAPGQENKIQNQESKKESAIINSAETLKNALAGGQTLECSYKMKNGDTASEIKGFMGGKKYKSTFTMKGEEYISVMDGETMYNWSAKTKQGTKMNIACIQELGKNLPQSESQKPKSSEEIADDMTDINCQPASAVDFSLPSDVTFTDTCQQMRNSVQQMQQIRNIPNGNNLP
jgi:hypothetical protein